MQAILFDVIFKPDPYGLMLIYSFGKSGYTSKFNSPFLLSEEHYRNDK